ncbi:MAG: FkbM family methyltransferase [Xanthomonadales bacterium]|nr:FkbM family methyltransferase [Xanthomonadales bacterium]
MIPPMATSAHASFPAEWLLRPHYHRLRSAESGRLIANYLPILPLPSGLSSVAMQMRRMEILSGSASGAVVRIRLSALDDCKLLPLRPKNSARCRRKPEPIPTSSWMVAAVVRPSNRDVGSAIGQGSAHGKHRFMWRASAQGSARGSRFKMTVPISMASLAHIPDDSFEQGDCRRTRRQDSNCPISVSKRTVSRRTRGFRSRLHHRPLSACPPIEHIECAFRKVETSQRRPSLFAPTRTLDWMCAGLGRLDFVKMDIEGHEIFAWRGAKDLFARFKPRIATEFHPLAMRENAAIDCRDYVDLMFTYSRQIQVIVSPDKLVACSNYEEVMTQWEQGDKRHGGNGSSHLDLYLAPAG